jgi:methionyl-tRNA formyltransferase
VVVAYGLILPPEALAIPRLGCINIHASLLPRWRGAAPVQRAILAGDAETGVTLMQMDAGLDTGPILAQRPLPISLQDDTASVLAALARLGAPTLLEVLAGIETGSLQPQPQPAGGVSYARKIDKAEARIDWQGSAAEIDRQVRAFRPWPVAETTHRGEQVRIHRAQPLELRTLEESAARLLTERALTATPGSILGLHHELLVVRCGSGLLGVAELQRAGRRSVSAREFANSLAVADEIFT